MRICGIDEAGKGPVIGPLVMAGVVFDEESVKELERLNIRDSKLVAKNKRKELFKTVVELAEAHKIVSISPEEIDSKNAAGINLNRLEAIHAAEIINELKPDVVYIDSPTAPDASRFGEIIKEYLTHKDVKIHAEHKADLNHREAGAASILAKVTRDDAIEQIKKDIGLEFGSGYSSDPLTQKFVKEHWKDRLSKHVRHSWGTIKRLKSAKNQKTLDF